MKFLHNRKLKYLLIGQMIVLAFLLSSINLTTTVHAKTNQTNQNNLSPSDLLQQMQNADLVAIYDPNAMNNIHVDGVINGSDNYPESFHSIYTAANETEGNGMNVSIAYNGTNDNNSFLFIGLQAPTDGWEAIGFNTLGYGMIGSDIKAGWITNKATGAVHVEDDYATAYTFPSNDPGSNDIVQAAASYDSTHNVTTIEMVCRMISNSTIDRTVNQAIDPSQEVITADKDILVNTSYSMLLAWGGNFDTQGLIYHQRKEIATIFIAPPGVAPRTATSLSSFSWVGDYSGVTNNNTQFVAKVTLKDNNSNGISGAVVGVYYEGLIADNLLATAITDTNGVATFNFTFQGQYSNPDTYFVAKFIGDMTHKKSVSNAQSVDFVGSVPIEEAPFLLIPLDMDYIVPWLTGIGSVSAVAFMWSMFAFVIYTVLYKNAVQPDGKKPKVKGGN